MMKIGMMTCWNRSCGASVHAEFIGKEWVRNGHELTIFANKGFYFSPDEAITAKDETYVIRNFSTPRWRKYKFFDPLPFLKTNFEIFVVQNLDVMPKKELLKIFPEIRKKAKTVLVIHEGLLPQDPNFYRFDWDAIVCFDERYRRFLLKAFPDKKIHIIPYPCHILQKGNKKEAKEKLKLPLDRKIILIFGFWVKALSFILLPLSDLNKKYHLLLLVLTKDEAGQRIFEMVKDKFSFPIEIRNEAPSIDKLYEYLHAVDALILHKRWDSGFFYFRAIASSIFYKKRKLALRFLFFHLYAIATLILTRKLSCHLALSYLYGAVRSALHKKTPELTVVSSTAHQCLGSGCPIVTFESEFFETLDEEVLKYSNLFGLKERLIEVFEEKDNFKVSQKAAEEFVARNSAEKIAQEYIELFKSL